MALRDRMRRLRREAQKDAVLIHQRDGNVRTFDRMHVVSELYLARMDLSIGRPVRQSEVLDAVRNATPESRRIVEEIAGRIGGGLGDLVPLVLDEADVHDGDAAVEDLSE
jgi:hypothetical protein